jgi:hypothetical protein
MLTSLLSVEASVHAESKTCYNVSKYAHIESKTEQLLCIEPDGDEYRFEMMIGAKTIGTYQLKLLDKDTYGLDYLSENAFNSLKVTFTRKQGASQFYREEGTVRIGSTMLYYYLK